MNTWIRDIFSKAGRPQSGGVDEQAADAFVDAAVVDDPILLSLADELRDLGAIEVPGAAKERTWALLRHELESSPSPAAAGLRPAASAVWRRWALGSAAVVAAAALALAVVFTGIDDEDQMAGGGTDSTQVVEGGTGSVSTTDSPGDPSTTGSSLEGVLPGTTSTSPSDPGTTAPSTGGTGTSTTAGSTMPTTRPSVTSPPATVAPSTTVPAATTTTTGDVRMARERREKSAVTAANRVANLVVAGDPAGAGREVAASARTGLAQMIGSLEAPYKAEVQSKSSTSSGVRVLVEITDRIDDGQGGTSESVKRFYFHVTFGGDETAVVSAIVKAGS